MNEWIRVFIQRQLNKGLQRRYQPNKWFFSFFANVWKDSGEVRSSTGRLFYVAGPDTPKSHRPIAVLVRDRNWFLSFEFFRPTKRGCIRQPSKMAPMISTTIEYAHDIHSDIWKLLISNYLQFDCKSIKLHAKLPANVQTNNYIQKTIYDEFFHTSD